MLKKAFLQNEKRKSKDDFIEIKGQYRLKWSESGRYVKILMTPVIENKDSIFAYIQAYYRAFMKDLPPEAFPTFDMGG